MDLEVVARVTSEGFYDDPVMSWVFPDPAVRLEALGVSFTSLARRFAGRGGRIDVLEDACAALWLPPDPPEGPEEDLPPPRSWHLFSGDVVQRFSLLSGVMEAAHPEEPHWYLGVIATLPDMQGRGLGAQVIAPVLEICDRDGRPAYLESSNARNLPFYFRHGWVQTGEIEVPDGPTLFPMWREPRPRGGVAR